VEDHPIESGSVLAAGPVVGRSTRSEKTITTFHLEISGRMSSDVGLVTED